MITVIYGPPGSGKTAYVNEHRELGDVIIDMDALCVALGSPDTHSHPEHVKRIAGSARASAIRKAIDLDVDAWVIDTWLRTQTLRDHPAARYVRVDPGQTVTMQRAERDGRSDRSLDAIRRWYLDPPVPPRAAVIAEASAGAEPDLGAGVVDWW